MKNKDKAIKQIFTFSISTWVNFLIGVLSTVLLTRLVSTELYGEINVFNTASATLMAIMCMGLDSSYIRFYNEPPSNNNRIQLAFKLIFLSLSVSVIAGVGITALFWKKFSFYIFGYANLCLTILLIVSVTSNLILRYYTITYRMTFNARQYTVQSILVQLITKFGFILAALVTFEINKVIGFSVIALFILVIIYSIKQKKDIIPSKIDLNYTGYLPVFKFAFFSAPTYIVLNLNSFFSQMIIRKAIDMNAVGVFASVNAFVAILNVLKGGFGTYWSAFMYANYKTEQKFIKKIHNYVMLILIVVFALIVCFKDVIYLMIGVQFHASKTFFSLLMIYPILNIALETTIYGLSIANKTQITLFIHTLSVAVNLVLSILLTQKYGLVGAAWASALSGILLFVCGTYWGQKYYPSIDSLKNTFIGMGFLFLIGILPVYIKSNLFLNIIMLGIILISCSFYIREILSIVKFAKNIIRNLFISRN